jgi:hypothetical protein
MVEELIEKYGKRLDTVDVRIAAEERERVAAIEEEVSFREQGDTELRGKVEEVETGGLGAKVSRLYSTLAPCEDFTKAKTEVFVLIGWKANPLTPCKDVKRRSAEFFVAVGHGSMRLVRPDEKLGS